ncbi:molybdopterin-dependent oxidoreductase [Gordonia hankookensis]|uniref:Molybdopterin-dependent oxidoreductase n=1 Tax=Gordonia hankookensis TaxID=589403 RepID=A0ABR7W6W5_9ACTN|nr:molybdopterin-dependent oxidoreductase [Gordonia hankookensis]MBD1318562.1 molybdopterin-dependent oxidoreductase [Gordonia hankookensis]
MTSAVETDESEGERRARATRVGLALATCFATCFVTGLLSHWIQHPPGWFAWPSTPVWLYRTTQGVHVLSGIAAIPLLLIKLGVVYRKLFERPLIGSPVRLIERLSIAVLVSASIFQLLTGLLNIAQWYPWRFFFTTTHHAMAYIVIGALLVHVAVKLPIIRVALGEAEPEQTVDDNGRRRPGGLDRRTVLLGAGGAVAVAVVAFAGQTVPALRRVAVFAPRSGAGPAGLPVNRTAEQAQVTVAATSDSYRLAVSGPAGDVSWDLAALRALPQHTESLPITCVEGWSADAVWSGVRLRDLVRAVGGTVGAPVRVISLERGPYAVSTVPSSHAADPRTLLALRLHGADLDIDHGFPVRLIAPNLPGVMQTKWVGRIEVS